MSSQKTFRLSAMGDFSQRNRRSRILNTVNGVSQEKVVLNAKNFRHAFGCARGQV